MTIDNLGRPLHDLRISIIDKCNFRCQYCMPAEVFGPDFKFLSEKEVLSFDEIERLAKIFSKLGVKKLRITGGEPLLRKNVHELISRLVKIDGIHDIGLTTNGVYLVKQARPLYEAGLRRLNVSLDSLDNQIFSKMNGIGVRPEAVLKGIDAALKCGFQIKVNMVVQKDVNESEIIPMAKYFKSLGVTLRFIEFMDVGNSNNWDWNKVVFKNEIYQQLSSHFQLEVVDQAYFGEVAKRYKYAGTNTEIGFITSVSESFCSTCTRARISADGKFYTCLFASEGHDLRKLLRSTSEDSNLLRYVENIWKHRNDRYSDERASNDQIKKDKIEMSYIGG